MQANDPLKDELEIRNLIATMVHKADTEEDLAGYLACFTEDGVWDLRLGAAPAAAGPRRGIDSIRQGALERRKAGLQGPGSHTLHVITTTAVQIDGDQAHARSHFMFLRETDTAPKIAVAAIYSDTFRRLPQGWRLSERVITGN